MIDLTRQLFYTCSPLYHLLLQKLNFAACALPYFQKTFARHHLNGTITNIMWHGTDLGELGLPKRPRRVLEHTVNFA